MPRFSTPTSEELRFTICGEMGEYVTTGQIRLWAEANGFSASTILSRLANYKSGHGKFNLTAAEAVESLERAHAQVAVSPIPEENVTSISPTFMSETPQHKESLIPLLDELYVPFGHFKDVKSIVKSKIFYPLFLTGLSGNGKTQSVQQSCAQSKRELISISITIETDEDDLLGGFRLVNGDTVYHYGPVVEAMERGAVLLLDEIDLASNKIMCLQSILDGKGVYLKKINKYVKPVHGFNIIATANTKGRGSSDGKFIGTNILNEAFLERFPVTFEQEYPTAAVETKILLKNFGVLGVYENADKFVKDLTTWADLIRKTYNDGGIEDVISTRRLVNIVKAYAIWGNILKAIGFCTNRFDDETRKVFVDLYKKVSAEEEEVKEYPFSVGIPAPPEDLPF